MEAIRKVQTVQNGLINIELPEQFWGKEVEIIILATSPPEENSTVPKKSLRGCLRQYANLTLIEYENEAWQTVVKEKYGHR